MDKRFWDDLNWVSDHHAELFDLYPNEWVAVYNKQVVAHGKSGAAVEQEAERQTGQPKTEFPVYYVDSGDTIYASRVGL
jgi:hypothetical protein